MDPEIYNQILRMRISLATDTSENGFDIWTMIWRVHATIAIKYQFTDD